MELEGSSADVIDVTEIEPLCKKQDGYGGSMEVSLTSSIGSQLQQSTTSSQLQRRTEATGLNKDRNFGDTVSRPDELDDAWCYISAKNAEKRSVHATSNVDTFIHLIKGNIGTGLLALPRAVSHVGYVLGPLGLLVLGVIATHCMVLLIESANKLCRTNNLTALDYSETFQFALLKRGASSRVAKVAKIVVNVFLIITQFGFCSVYLVFVGRSLQQIMLETYCIDFGGVDSETAVKYWIVIIVGPMIVFSWIRNLDNLAPLSMFANLCILVGLAMIVYAEVTKFAQSDATVERRKLEIWRMSDLPLFFGNAVFSFEGIGVVLPLENKMRNPLNARYVIYAAMSVVTILYSVFGLVGYLVYGSDVQGSITLNLCSTNVGNALVFTLAKMLFAYSVFASYLLQFYVPMDFLEPIFYDKIKLDYLTYRFPKSHKFLQTLVQLGFRVVLVLVTAALAIGIPDLDDLLTLVGALASSALALVFPPLIHTLTFWDDPQRKCLRIFPKLVWMCKDIAIITLGILGFIAGTAASIVNIVQYFKKEGDDAFSCLNSENSFQADCHLLP